MTINSKSVLSKITTALVAVAVAVSVMTFIGDYQKTILDKEAKIVKLEQQKVKILAKQAALLKLSIQRTPLTDVQLAFLLKSVGFKGKALNTAWAVVKKESNGRPMAFNDNTQTGDSSYGIFQINIDRKSVV